MTFFDGQRGKTEKPQEGQGSPSHPVVLPYTCSATEFQQGLPKSSPHHSVTDGYISPQSPSKHTGMALTASYIQLLLYLRRSCARVLYFAST